MPKIELKFEATGDGNVKSKVNDLNKAIKALGLTAEQISGRQRLLTGLMGSLGLGSGDVRLGKAGGPSYILQSNQFLAQAAAKAKQMGQLYAGPNWRQIAASAAIAPFHPWVAARGMAGAFGGGAGGGTGGVGGALFGGGFFKFEVALAAITTVIHAARLAFHQLVQAVERGSKLYERSAHIGTSPFKLAGLSGALEAVGISSTQADRLAVRGEYPLKSGGKQIKLGEFMLGSGRGVFQAGELQQIKNMVEYINLFGQRGSYAFKAMGDNAQRAFEITFAIKNVTRDWEAFMSQIVSDVGPILVQTLRSIEDAAKGLLFTWREMPAAIHPLLGMLRLMNPLIEQWNKLMGNIPSNVGAFKGGILPGGGNANIHASAWEKMGFVIGGTSVADYARQTAQNTKVIADAVTRSGSNRPQAGTLIGELSATLMPFSLGYNAP